jgi:integrase
VGFEPTLPFRVNTLSKRAPSATRPSLRRIRTIRGFPSQTDNTPGEARYEQYCSIHSRTPLPQKCITFHGFLVHARLKWLPSESPTQEQLKDTVMRMREKGLKETGCNAAIRAINAYLHWNSGSGRKCGVGCTHLRIQQLKEPQNILPTLTADQVTRLVNWKPKPRHFYQRRLHLLTLLLLDTGCRITEALTLRVRDLDMDNMLITLDARGENREEAIQSYYVASS